MPARQGDSPFTWSLRSGTLPDGEGAAVPVEAAYERSYNGFTLGYVLSATIDRARLKKAAITDDDLRDIRIRYHDDWTEAPSWTRVLWTGSLPNCGGGTTGLPGMARVSPPAASGFNSPGP